MEAAPYYKSLEKEDKKFVRDMFGLSSSKFNGFYESIVYAMKSRDKGFDDAADYVLDTWRFRVIDSSHPGSLDRLKSLFRQIDKNVKKQYRKDLINSMDTDGLTTRNALRDMYSSTYYLRESRGKYDFHPISKGGYYSKNIVLSIPVKDYYTAAELQEIKDSLTNRIDFSSYTAELMKDKIVVAFRTCRNTVEVYASSDGKNTWKYLTPKFFFTNRQISKMKDVKKEVIKAVKSWWKKNVKAFTDQINEEQMETPAKCDPSLYKYARYKAYVKQTLKIEI